MGTASAYLECDLYTTASHAESHGIHVHVIHFSSRDIGKLIKGVRSVFIFVDRHIDLNLDSLIIREIIN